MQTRQAHIGGTFAPPLPPEKLEEYRELAHKAGPSNRPVAEAMLGLCDMMESWHEVESAASTPAESGAEEQKPALQRTPIASLLGTRTALHPDEVATLDRHVPWEHEIEGLKLLFDGIDANDQKTLRDAAHHLLWFAIELNKDREPLTADKLNLQPPPSTKDE